MRIIFSRKGFDSAAGGGPSPIVDGRPVSLPIPDTKGLAPTTYGERGLGELVGTASRGRLSHADLCHDDPMFLPGGRCIFGQCGGAQTHLDRQGVGIGDVFLFFGWFAGVGQGDHHRIFGYLEVEEIVRLDGADKATRQRFADFGHPHAFGFHHANRSDTLYVGKGRTASHASDALRLTREGMSRTHWRVPEWLHEVGLSYHRGANRWPAPNHLISVAQGQEFVADIGGREEALQWLAAIIAEINRSG
ncbi:hypothetical protein E3U23_01665 [Erythrobacter litoralis]|uniref:Nmad3 family putative nucleotide modification protein n=1 Tax=Erythrobacter litoralis TaxID=39960 RepID=UPI00243579E2|nr:hypothetical protein [Erythrobacter litoralis]MDG6077906.1 hypothetical protein [Erythrobacter litoralis]